MSIVRHETKARMSQGVIYGGVVHLAGQTGGAEGTSAAEQTMLILANIERLLTECGTDKKHLISANIWVSDMTTEFQEMNAVWDAWVPEGTAPVRACVEAKLARPHLKVEIMVTAARPDG